MKIIFVRHGESENNVISEDKADVENSRDFELRRSADPSITSLGRSQVARAGERLAQRGLSVERVYCSFLQRALQSAEILCSFLPSAAIHLDADRFEVGGCYKLGDASNEFRVVRGITPREAMARFPGVVIPKEYSDSVDDAWYRGTTKETWSEGVARAHRVMRWMQGLALERPTGAHVVVAHGDFLNALVQIADPTREGKYFPFANGSLTRFDVDSCGEVRLAFIGEMEFPVDETPPQPN